MTATCPNAAEHPLMLSCACGYLSRSARELIADRILPLLPKPGEFVGNCCEHCAAIEELLKGLS